MEWYEFLNHVWDWSESTIKSKIYQLEDIEPDTLIDVLSMLSLERSNQLIRKAIQLQTPIDESLYDEIRAYISDDTQKRLENYVFKKAKTSNYIEVLNGNINIKNVSHRFEPAPKMPKKFWLFTVLTGLFAGLSDHSDKKSDTCDGDCDNCPAHYGYRYGRWYYGHHHTSGCERGGRKQ